MMMVYVPAGTFKMGSEIGDDRERPVHDVTLDAFWIDRTEVTNAQYAQCVAADKCGAPSSTHSYTRDSYYENDQYDDYPVIYVNWINADKYCTWAGGQLPTEAQWEYAARGPDAHEYPWGSTFDGTRLNFCDKNCPFDWADKTVDDGYADTAPVGSYPNGASWVGALDLAGNVWEWVNDWYGLYPDSNQTNPTGPASGIQKVLRGGSWYYNADGGRTAYRVHNPPAIRDNHFGFRCVAAGPGG
jgi:serine/threonine-protein kinase